MSSSNLPRPEPVTRAGTIAGAVAGTIVLLGGLARTLGWLTDDVDLNAVAMQASNLILGAGVLWSTLAPLVLAMWARGKVTPLADPRDAEGNPLAVLHDLDKVAREFDLDLDDPPGAHAAPEGPPGLVEPTPIAAQTAALLTDTQPAMLAVRR